MPLVSLEILEGIMISPVFYSCQRHILRNEVSFASKQSKVLYTDVAERCIVLQNYWLRNENRKFVWQRRSFKNFV